MNMMSAVSALSKHIINEILIPRIKAEIENSNSVSLKQSLEFYKNLYKDDDRCYYLAKRAITGIKERLAYIRKADLEDFIGNIISTTIQSETNDYHKFLKSRNGFWSSTFDIKENPENFEKTFSYFLFKAVQSESRSITARFKSEVNIIEDEDGEYTLLTKIEDDRETEKKQKRMISFEDKIEAIKQLVETSDQFDELDRTIFNRWFLKKDTENFCETVNMLQDIYNPIILELKESGKDITSSALFFRWKRIRIILKQFLLN